MLARCMPSTRVRPSVTGRHCVKTIGRIKLVCGTDASFHLSHTVLSSRNSVISKHNDTSLALQICPELFGSGEKIAPRQVDRVVNKTRRRSSLLSTLMTAAAPWLNGRCYSLTAHIVYYTSVDRNALTPR